MTNKMIVSFIVGIALGIGLIIPSKWYQKSKVIYKVKTDTVNSVDTIIQFVKVDKYIIKRDTIIKPEIRYSIKSINHYQDTTEIEEGFKLWYKAAVDGSLLNISLNYLDKRPVKQKTIFNTQTITNTKTIQPKGFYVGLRVGINNITPSALYLRNQNGFTAGYNVLDNSISIGYFRKL